MCTTHWVYITCTNITPTQHTNLWKCAPHTTHAAPAQPTHPTNTTNQSLTISTQTINASADSTPGTPPRKQATNPPTVGTPQTTPQPIPPAIYQPILSTPQTAPVTSASTPATPQTTSTNSAPTPITPQITNLQQPQSAQQSKQDLKILQININGIRKKLTEWAHTMKTNNIDIVTVQETKLVNHHKTPIIPQDSTHRTDRTHKKGGGLITFVKHNINFTPLITPNNINRSKTELPTI